MILHANWSDSALHLWAEDPALSASATPAGAAVDPATAPRHPFASESLDLMRWLPESWRPVVERGRAARMRMRLPAAGARPIPSDQLNARELEDGVIPTLETFEIPTFALTAMDAAPLLLALVEVTSSDGEGVDGDLGHPRLAGCFEFFAESARLCKHIAAQQRFIPTLVQASTGELRGAWHPWLSDGAAAELTAKLVGAMPAAARAVVDRFNHEPWPIVEDFLNAVTDAECRRPLLKEGFKDAVESRDPSTDVHVAWLQGLLQRDDKVHGTPGVRQDMSRRIRQWISVLEERGASSSWRLLFRLSEPDGGLLGPDDAPDPAEPAWKVTFHLAAVEKAGLTIDAADIWLLGSDSVTVQGRRVDRPQELLLGELGRATRFYRRLEEALEDAEPTTLNLNTRQAYEFLREVRPTLVEQGFQVEAPEWWDSPMARLGAKLRLESDEQNPFTTDGGGLTGAATPQLGLGALIKYRWEIAVGDATLSLAEFEQLANKKTPLVRMNGRWVEIRPEDVQAAIRFIRENPGGTIKLAEALRLAYGSDLKQTGIPVVGLEATGWLAAFLNSEANARSMGTIETPGTFRGTLRPYQIRGVSWLIFQEQLGFGVCLADDMGLGKTIQLLALLAWEREHAEREGNPGRILPTLLVAPMSVVGNWIHETARFCPHLKVMLHHGGDRLQGEAFLEKARNSDLIISTYALANRDKDLLGGISWGRIVLDEAQYIKNPSAKQSQAVRQFDAGHRIALTGTPVENRLTELWSIMDFLNPGYLGPAAGFRTRFGVPIERYHDRQRAEQLRGLIRPFILRRLKTDPTVVADLPEKLETKEFAHLTAEQASLYESCVRRMLGEVDQAEGIQRRGLVLAALVKLKQICNHPSLFLKDHPDNAPRAADPSRSGKCIRLLEMLDEVLAEGDQALVFTQFREMGDLLAPMIRQQLGRNVLFLHGGTTQTQRQAMIDQFQKADGTTPVLLLSLRAGGVGLNLTAATHVFHFDRWWNPAVENQATDRAYRIGQTRTVQVHKFIVHGTLEERIDQMIESKTELAENIIGAGENWLADLNTDQLRDILTLRNDAVDDVEV